MSQALATSPGVASHTADPIHITAVRATPVSVPLSFPYRWGPGAYRGFTRTIIEVETDQGIVGVGEAGHARDARITAEWFAPRLIGADALDRVACERRALPSIKGMLTSGDLTRLRAWSGVEMALWDIAGKATGLSLAALLGGRARDAVSFSDYFALSTGGDDTPSSVAERCADAVRTHGAKVLEGKVGVLPLDQEVELIRAVRHAVGEEVPIRLDANMSWDVATAREAVARLVELGVTWIEEPVVSQAELLRVRAGTSIAFSSHQVDLQQAARDGVPDAFVVSIHYQGGIRRTVELARACALFGIGFWFRSPNTAVAVAAELHIAAALDSMIHPSQNLARWLGDDVTEHGPFHATGGVVPVPQGPGLGVSLDPEAMERCAERARSAPMNDPYAYG